MITKSTMVVILNSQILIYWLFPHRQRKFFRWTAKISQWQIPQLSISFSAERNANTKATEYVTFGFSFSVLVFLPFSESLNLTVCQRYGFLRVLAAIMWESSDKHSDKQLVLRIVKALPKASDTSASDWLYQHTWKNTIFFHVFCYGFSQGRKSLYNAAIYVINSILQSVM